MKMNQVIVTFILLPIFAFFMGCITGTRLIIHTPEQAAVSASIQPEAEYNREGTSRSLFTDHEGYLSVEQGLGKTSVKPLSILHKMIAETCEKMDIKATKITPLGPGVMINGEMCYSAVHITLMPVPISHRLKKSN